MTLQRVAVTGIGVITPIGTGVERFWEATLRGDVGTAPLTRFDATPFHPRVAAQVDDFDPLDYMSARRARWTDRFSQFSIAAARLAFEDAGFSVAGNGAEIGCWIGSALGGLALAEAQHDVFRNQGLDAVRPLLAISVFGGAATSNVSLELGLSGPNVANGNSCAGGAVAIGEAYRAVARGDVRAALAGGVEAPLAPLIFGAFAIIKAMSTRNGEPQRASRPFDADRDGFVMAEGAGLLLLERFEDAVRRGAKVYGEIAGYGISNDAHHLSAPRPDGKPAAHAMTSAMLEAGVAPPQVDLINAHGSATVLGDRAESLALRVAFGDALDATPVTATKGQHGHALAATGAWEAALALLSLSRGRVPKVVNFDRPDPRCDLPCVRETSDDAPRIVLSNSAGFGGINAALVCKAVA